MVEHNFKTVLMHFAKKNDTNSLWNYVTGLRGNDDVNNGTWKEIVTTIIRGNVSEALSFNCVWSREWVNYYKKNPSEVIKMMDNLFRNTHIHAQTHARMSLLVLAQYYDSRHGKQYKDFAYELRIFCGAIEHMNSKDTLDSFMRLHEMWG